MFRLGAIVGRWFSKEKEGGNQFELNGTFKIQFSTQLIGIRRIEGVDNITNGVFTENMSPKGTCVLRQMNCAVSKEEP